MTAITVHFAFQPGDWIVYRRDRSLSVVQYEDARELELVIKTSAGA